MAFTIPNPRWEEPALLQAGVKPTGAVTIDWSHPLAKGLIFCGVPGHSELVAGGQLTLLPSNSNLRPSSPHGICVESTSAIHGGGYWDASRMHEALEGKTNYSMATFLRIDSMSAWGALAGAPYTTSNSTPHKQFALQRRGTNAEIFFKAIDGTTRIHGETKCYTSTGLEIDGKWHSYSASRRTEAPYIHIFADGSELPLGYNIFDGTGAYSSTNKRPMTVMNANDTAPTEGMDGDCAIVCCWDRALTDAEHAEFSRNPYQFLIPA